MAASNETGIYDTQGSAKGMALAGNYTNAANVGGELVILRFIMYEVYLPLLLREYSQP